MSIIAAIRAYLALNKQQKRLLKNKRLEGDYTPEAWIRLLGGLASYDTHGDRLRRFSGKAAIVMLVATFIGFFIPPLLVISLSLLAVSGGIWLITRRADLSNHLRVFVLPLIALLGDDVKPGRTLHLRLDLRGGTIKDKRTEKKEPYRKGAYHKIVETLYQDDWLSGDTVLSDGSRLQLQLSDSIRELKKTKRNARNKTKTKTKYKIKGLMDVQLKLPQERYRPRELPESVKRGPRIDTRPGEKWLGLRGRQVVPRGEQDLQSPPLEPLLELLTGLYRTVEIKEQGEMANA